MVHSIDSDTQFDVVFLDFWEPGDIPDWYVYLKILTRLDRMTGFGMGAAIGLKENTPDQVAQLDFGKFFVTFGIIKRLLWTQMYFFLGCSRIVSSRPHQYRYMNL